jgi:hypothetical protein
VRLVKDDRVTFVGFAQAMNSDSIDRKDPRTGSTDGRGLRLITAQPYNDTASILEGAPARKNAECGTYGLDYETKTKT